MTRVPDVPASGSSIRPPLPPLITAEEVVLIGGLGEFGES